MGVLLGININSRIINIHHIVRHLRVDRNTIIIWSEFNCFIYQGKKTVQIISVISTILVSDNRKTNINCDPSPHFTCDPGKIDFRQYMYNILDLRPCQKFHIVRKISK